MKFDCPFVFFMKYLTNIPFRMTIYKSFYNHPGAILVMIVYKIISYLKWVSSRAANISFMPSSRQVLHCNR